MPADHERLLARRRKRRERACPHVCLCPLCLAHQIDLENTPFKEDWQRVRDGKNGSRELLAGITGARALAHGADQ